LRVEKGELEMIAKGTKAFLIFLFLFSFPVALLAVPSGKIATWEGGGQGKVTFEGDEHAEKGYSCDSCHPSLFQMKKGAAKITMDSLNKGQFCGACHNGKAAFSTGDPRKCHECHKTKKKHHDHDDKHHD
jgi:c(7)-type cytochrome triheme protein